MTRGGVVGLAGEEKKNALKRAAGESGTERHPPEKEKGGPPQQGGKEEKPSLKKREFFNTKQTRKGCRLWEKKGGGRNPKGEK